MPVNRPTPDLRTGLPVGPGKLSTPELSSERVTARYELGDRQADRAFNGDGLFLSAEARLRAGAKDAQALERLQMEVGVEGVVARVRLAKDGKADPSFDGVRLKDGFFRGQLEDGRDWLEERPVAYGAAVVGAVVVAHEVAKREGPIGIDLGKATLYEKNGFKASIDGEVELTGTSRFVRAKEVGARLEYQTEDFGSLQVRAAHDFDRGPRAEASWSKRFDSGVYAHANASWDEKETRAFVGLSYRW